ncbi:TetR/AcrR family transcriptional regulator [Actinorugispora endophytica]|uniref:TetR family transcriptional regulator n=1 Tax=Actinorugispora endophytica TaxID=1605990 RepID=A0A4R6UDS3_9ACTN|nr:TetR/AcrR family transcriptional regulator [Actinorugispora endophytica]TDQ44252.1 TetR family transcriptional regulator [Actinorugispora endophytica]
MSGDWRADKRARTRARIQEAALELFLEQGFDATTVARIAERAGVSHMTFFRYFPTKEDVVLQDGYDPMLEEMIRSRPAGEPPVTRIRTAVRDGLALVYDADRDALLARTRLLLSTPGLRAGLWENQEGTQRLFERALGGPDADGRSPLRVRAAAAACLAALVTALTAWVEGDGAEPLPDLVDEAFDALRAEFG